MYNLKNTIQQLLDSIIKFGIVNQCQYVLLKTKTTTKWASINSECPAWQGTS
jgi:hypothetical protein